MVLEKALAGPLNLLVKFSTLQEYGVDKPFFLENDNVDASQRNVVFLVRGEKAKTVMKVAGMYSQSHNVPRKRYTVQHQPITYSTLKRYLHLQLFTSMSSCFDVYRMWS